MRSTDRTVTTTMVTAVPTGSHARNNRSTEDWVTLRYKAKKGRAVRKAERSTYDLATKLMLAGRIKSFHVYEDGWTFTNRLGAETAPFTLAEAGEYVAALEAAPLRAAA